MPACACPQADRHPALCTISSSEESNTGDFLERLPKLFEEIVTWPNQGLQTVYLLQLQSPHIEELIDRNEQKNLINRSLPENISAHRQDS